MGAAKANGCGTAAAAAKQIFRPSVERQGLITPILDRIAAERIISAQAPRWRNWQTHYFEVVAPQGVQVQILSWAF